MSRFLVGVSGGPDSMMLLDYTLKKNEELIVAHVNYQKRESAFRDEMIVANYTKKHNLVLERLYPYKQQGNFQNWARELRYKWFAQLCQYYNCEAILVGHNLNDLVETYLLQRQRKGLVEYYGLAQETLIENTVLIRPLLSFSRGEILSYLKENKISYGLDESNEDSIYQRNLIRKNVSILSKAELLAYKDEIDKKNEEKKIFIASIDETKAFFQQDKRTGVHLLRAALKEAGYFHFSGRHIDEILQQLAKNNSYRYQNHFNLSLLNNKLELRKIDNSFYSYVFESLAYGDYGHFKLSKQGASRNGLEIFSDDWPITIRNWQEGDKIKMKFGTKRVSRFFIDNKIEKEKRATWPVVVNRKNEVIFVADWGADVEHFTNNANLYVIK